jgi:hypothetical protein
MGNNYGSGVSRVLDPTATQYTDVILQQGKPPLDAEFNLLQDLAGLNNRTSLLRGTPSGFLGNETNPRLDFITNPSWSNWFRFGPQRPGEQQAFMWANVNGWLIPVTGTLTGTPPGSPNNTDTSNVMALSPPPGNAGDFRIDFGFLEVWLARVPPNPSTLNKPASSAIYRYGNINGGMSYLPDDIIDPAIGFETSERVQVQYAIRFANGLVGLSSNPDGFDPTVVFAQAAATSPTAYIFQNMRQTLGDPGLWRAGDGTQNALGTVDGYSYAIPICAVFRRNSTAWNGDPSQNLNGAFNRNITAVDRTGIQTYTATATLAVDFTVSSAAITLVTAAGIPFPISPASPVLIQIGDELLSYAALTTGSPPQLTGIVRGLNGTRPELHRAGSTVTILSGRPDGLFADQVAHTDILDLRHIVNPNGFDLDALLKGNLDKLLRGQLRANWKRTGAGPQGPFCFYQDKITIGSVSLGVTELDGFDGIREIFSDAAAVQTVECVVQPNSNSLPATVTGSLVGFSINISAVQPSLGLLGNIGRAVLGQLSPNDTLQFSVAQLKSGLSAGDADQVRWVFDGAPGAVTLRVDGQTVPVDPSLYTVTGSTSAGGPITNVLNNGGQCEIVTTTPHNLLPGQVVIVAGVVGVPGANGTFPVTIIDTLHYTLVGSTFSGAYSSGGSTFSPNLTPNDDLFITLGPNFPSSTNPIVSPGQVYITLSVMYGPGRGISRRPDALHSVSFLNPASDLLVRPMGVPSSDQQLSTAWLPLWQRYQSGTFKNNVPVQCETFADLGSKSIVVAPFRRMVMPTSFFAMDGRVANPYVTQSGFSGVGTGSSTGTSTFTDPTQNFPQGLVNFAGTTINVGDVLIVTNGPQPGRYTILAVPSSTTLTVAGNLPVAKGLNYVIEHIIALVAYNQGSANNGTAFQDTSGSVNFGTAGGGVIAGDLLYIVTPTYSAKYTVLSVTTTSTTNDTLNVERPIFTGSGPATGLQYIVCHCQGNMPVNASNGTTAKWGATDPLNLFSGMTQANANYNNMYVTLPRHLVPSWGSLFIPPLWKDTSTFAQGVNFMSLSIEGAPTGNGDINYVPYSNSGFTYAIFSTVNPSPPASPATYNTAFNFGGTNNCAGIRKFTDTRALGRQGLQLPPFYGVARMFAVYEYNNYFALHSAYDPGTRAPTGSGATNLLRQNMNPSDGPVMWVEIDADGDSTFILNANAIDLTRIPTWTTGQTFAGTDFVIEASIFGFDRGSFDATREFRLVLTYPTGSSVMRVQGNTINRYGPTGNVYPGTSSVIAGPTCVLPGPATASDQLVINYSRTPYQGDPWGSQTNFIDIPQNVGPLQSGSAYQVASTKLNQTSLTRPNQKLFEVLASVGFATTMGTGRVSGNASTSPITIKDPGFENVQAYPPTSPTQPRPVTLVGSFVTDYPEVGTDYLGATERLPLGALLRDKDFRGGLLASGEGTLAPVIYYEGNGLGAPAANLAVSSTLEQNEILLSTATDAAGAPSDLIVQVDGEQNNYALIVNFRTLRGGSVFSATGFHPGGEVILQHPTINAPDGHTNVLEGQAYLVRNYTTTVGASEVSPGGELMLLVVTNAIFMTGPPGAPPRPGYINVGTNGTGEGWASADVYRIDGHPMLRDNVRLFVDPTTIPLTLRST